MQNTTTLGENQRNGLYPSSQTAFEEAVRAARMLPSMHPENITASRKRKLQTPPWSRREVTECGPLLTPAPPAGPDLGPSGSPHPPGSPTLPTSLGIGCSRAQTACGKDYFNYYSQYVMGWYKCTKQQKEMAESLKLKITDLQTMN